VDSALSLSTDWAAIASLDLICRYFVRNRVCKTRMHNLEVVYKHEGLHLALRDLCCFHSLMQPIQPDWQLCKPPLCHLLGCLFPEILCQSMIISSGSYLLATSLTYYPRLLAARESGGYKK
jgi:hypothetical protein